MIKGQDIVVPILLNSDNYTDLLFYKRHKHNGTALSIAMDGKGGFSKAQPHKYWVENWDYIVPLTPVFDDIQRLVFYRKTDGKAQIQTVKTLSAKHVFHSVFNKTWARNWDAILTFNSTE